MKYTRLPHTDMDFSAVGLGGWPFCIGYDWANQTVPDVSSIISAALETGINWIDTAPVYEQSEYTIGKALKGRRHKVFLATKCGLVKKGSWPVHDLKTIQTQLDQSLAALGTDYIDLYQIHYPDPEVPLAEALETLYRFKQQGKIRAIGVCNVSVQQLESLKNPLSGVQQQFSLLANHADLRNLCCQKQIPFIGYGVLGGGILSGKYKNPPNFRRADARNYFYKYYKGPLFEKACEVCARLDKVAKKYSVTSAQIALAWALSKSGTLVLAGAKQPKQVIENATSCTLTLSKEEILFLEEGLCK